MAAVPIIGSGEYVLIVDGKHHEYCKDRKTAEIKLEQLWNANRKGRKGTKTSVQPKSQKKAKTAPGRKGSQGTKPKATKGSTTKPKSKSVTAKKPHALHPNPLLDALS
jgi:hypothetical protein